MDVMSRSRKKPYVKDKGLSTREYWSRIRREWKQKIKQDYYKDNFVLRNPKEIINDWDYCDWIWHIVADKNSINRSTLFYSWTEEDVKKYTRK